MTIDYSHAQNLHSIEGPRAALPIIFGAQTPASLLDVGCGTGTWLKAALEYGVPEVHGIDGIDTSKQDLLVPADCVHVQDLTKPWDLGRCYDVVLCLEVAEHLPPRHGTQLIAALTRHSATVVFSAACPGQVGQNHVNGQWPSYWQRLFNTFGYVCSDDIRWKLWDDERVEPWYRQNMFVASRNPKTVGCEPRIRSVLHPEIELQPRMLLPDDRQQLRAVEQGDMPAFWYLSLMRRAAAVKLRRFLSRWLSATRGTGVHE